MGDSACFMPAFSYTSGVSNEENPLHALGESVSFGRFMTESLSWEKWSSFSHKRHVEEAERYAQPGSVAQKKAFFEAHYKRIAAAKKAAAALLEQENAANNAMESELENQESNDNNNIEQDSETMNQISQVVVPEKKQELMDSADGLIVNASSSKLEFDGLESTNLATEEEVLREISLNVDNQNMVSGLGINGIQEMDKPFVKNHNTDEKDVSKSVSKKRPVVSSLRSSIYSKIVCSPAKHLASVHSTKENSFTPSTIKSKLDSMNTKRSTPKSHRKSINFTPAKEPDRVSTLAIRKSESSRTVTNSYKAPRDLATPLKTPITASVKGKPRQSSVTPCSVNKSASCSKSLSACQKKLQSTTLSTPFLLRTELRAEKRKQRLEEKFNDKVAEKVQMQTTVKEIAEKEVRKLRQSLCFRARPLPDFYRARETSNKNIKKTPEMLGQSPKVGGKSCTSTIEALTPLTRSLTKDNVSKNVSKKNSQTPSRNLSLPAITPRQIQSKKLSTDQQKH